MSSDRTTAAALAALGRAIREQREQHEMSRAELARKAGIGEGLLASVEAGHTDPPLDLLLALADALGVGAAALVGHIEAIQAGATLPVPAALIARVREGASEVAKAVAEAIDNGENLHDCARRLEAIAGLLDVLDSADPDTTLARDVAAHGEALRQAVETMLPLMEGWITEVEPADREAREDELWRMRQLAAQINRATGGEQP